MPAADRVPRVQLAAGYSIPRIINGCWQLAVGHSRAQLSESVVFERLLQRVRCGLDTFDCGDIYTGVEELLGRFRIHVKERLNREPQIHTKFVPDLDCLLDVDRAYVARIVDRSLRRLGVERLDLVQFYWWDASVDGCVETALLLDDLRRAGKIRLLGTTNFDCHRLSKILDAGVPLVSNQVQYSLLDRRPERGMAELCEQRGVHLLSYGTLAGGLLSDDGVERFRSAAPGRDAPNRSLTKYRLVAEEAGGEEALARLLAALTKVARRHQVTVSDVALSWTRTRPQFAAVILGTSGATDRDLSTALDLQLDHEDEQRIEEALAQLRPIPGDVYELESDREGPHGRIMKYNLNRGA